MPPLSHLRVSCFALAIVALTACETNQYPDAPRVISRNGDGPVAKPHQKIGQPYQIAGIWYYPERPGFYDRTGEASWYGPKFHNRLTANGEIFDMDRLSAAHPTLPLPSKVRVTNLENGSQIIVRVNDRGPFAHGREIDLSKAAAEKLGFIDQGTANVRVEYLGDASMAEAITRVGQSGPELAYRSSTGEPYDTVKTRIISGPEPVAIAQSTVISSYEATPFGPDTSEYDAPIASTPPIATTPVVAATVVTPQPVIESAAYFVQVGAFSSVSNAHRAADGFGYDTPVKVAQIKTASERLLYRVRLGPYDSSYEAENALQTAVNQGFSDARLVAP